MVEISPIQSNKPTSFHSIALNFTYVIILAACHFVIPYIHELVFSFFNGLFLILSIFLYFYLNAVLRTSSISHFSYFSLFFRIVVSILILALSIIFIAFITNTVEIIQRLEFLRFLLYLSLFSLMAMIVTKYLYSLIKPKEKLKFVLLTDQVEEVSVEKLNSFTDNIKRVKQFHISEIDSMINYAIDEGVASVYISIDSQNLNNLENLVNDLSKYAFDLFWILPNSFFKENALLNFTKPILLNGSPVSLDTNQYLLKRSLDVFGAISILITISPLLILVAGLIKISDRGPIFYNQLRHGQYGKEFNMLKFRSMVVGSDYTDLQVTHDDSRVTLIGKAIRKTSFDEIPQLFNVLRGRCL